MAIRFLASIVATYTTYTSNLRNCSCTLKQQRLPFQQEALFIERLFYRRSTTSTPGNFDLLKVKVSAVRAMLGVNLEMV